MKTTRALCLFLPMMALSACAATPAAPAKGWMIVADAPAASPAAHAEPLPMGDAMRPDPARIRVTGRGAPPFTKTISPTQRRLLAMRAAQLDAYRQVAEQVHGFKIAGSSSVSNLIAINDLFRVYVDGYLRGVRIVSTDFKPDGTSESVAEIMLNDDFIKAYRSAQISADVDPLPMPPAASHGSAAATAFSVEPVALEGSKLPAKTASKPASKPAAHGGTSNDFYLSH